MRQRLVMVKLFISFVGQERVGAHTGRRKQHQKTSWCP